MDLLHNWRQNRKKRLLMKLVWIPIGIAKFKCR
jgi:hypothetical protein